MFKKVSQERRKEVDKDRKWKQGNTAKKSRRKVKHKKFNDNSLQARRDYAHNDSSSTIADVVSDVPRITWRT